MVRLIIATYLWAVVMALGVWDYYIIKPTESVHRFPPCHRPKIYQEVLMPVVKVRANGGIGSGVIIATTDYTDKHRPACQSGAAGRLTQVYILTAAHVVGDESTVAVYIYDYEIPVVTIELARVVSTDTYKDLALLRYTSRQRYKQVRLAPRDYQPYLFTEVYAVGCSLGLNPRPLEGIITSIGINKWEISAPVLPGNSGGGVFLKDTHELIGITVWVRTYYGQLVTTMAGVIPIHEIYEFLKKTPLMNCEEHKSEGLTCWFVIRCPEGTLGAGGPEPMGRPEEASLGFPKATSVAWPIGTG